MTIADDKPKRVGRPPGRPKTGGRKKGTPNKISELGREYIIKKSSALPFLCDVAAGRKVTVASTDDPRKKVSIYPTVAMRLKAVSICGSRTPAELATM